MINNGFVNKNAIEFKIEKLEKPLTKGKDQFILFQFDPNFPQVKYVWLNGEVKLPPIKMNSKVNNFNSKENIAIIGTNVDVKSVPPEFKLIGYFNTPNSYKLNSELWLIPSKFNIDLKSGTNFIINTPNNKESSVLEKIIEQNPIKNIDAESYGSYALNSNKLLNMGIKISLIFVVIIFMITGTVWISKEKSLIRILFLSGLSIYRIFINIVRYKILPYILFSILVISISIAIQDFTCSLWSNRWILYSFYMYVVFCVYLLLFCYTVILYTVGKGGKQF
ncbi:hypothetical protein GJU40_04690 [Bacillus lacus]|uniref:Uncharacterized protein n=1 Tax=Metabacillus lacus TaxID=1983721 RepID=A0A7X2IXH3_9BACI|nr:hypothetical protein [Metabacillus lacus]MRX71471.1 hypothetical protein [Metabacillus lacus]